MKQAILSIDQGTSSSRSIIFNELGIPLVQHQIEFDQVFPHDGWVEHSPEALWQTTLACCRTTIKALDPSYQVIGIGITNQRETTVIWDKQSGKAVYNAIVWQDRRTASYCEQLKTHIDEKTFQKKTGLLLDPYFSASKIHWILENIEGVRERAKRDELAFGTVDTFLLWHLTGGRVHATDATNASRTALFNIAEQMWDQDLLDLFNIPRSLLPTVLDSAALFGVTDRDLLGEKLPIAGIAGDQQAALVGQGCFSEGAIKSTYGTGCFMMQHTGKQFLHSSSRLLSTVAYRINGETSYALEGSNYMAGATIQWLRDQLGIISHASESEGIAKKLDSNGGVYLIPAFTGLGAPHWKPNARGMIVGLTRDSHRDHIVRAALESVVYQTRDLLEAMEHTITPTQVKVDGGMANNHWLLQFMADILNLPVLKTKYTEATARGAAFLAGLQMGIYASLEETLAFHEVEKIFIPTMDDSCRENLYGMWRRYLSTSID